MAACDSSIKSLVLTLQGAHNVKAADSNGLSDPYAIVHHVRNAVGLKNETSLLSSSSSGSSSDNGAIAARAIGSAAAPVPAKFESLRKKIVGRSHICYATLNPVWEFQSFLPEVSVASDALYIEVWDYDEKSSDDFLGACFVYLSNELIHSGKDVPLALSPRPKKKDTRITGWIDVSFQFDEPVESSLLIKKRLKTRTLISESVSGRKPRSFTAYQYRDKSPERPRSKSPRGARRMSVVSPSLAASLAASTTPFPTAASSTSVTAVFDDEDSPSSITRPTTVGAPFSLELTVHSASDLRRPGQVGKHDPFVVVALVSPDPQRARTVARSHIHQQTSAASWELRCAVPSMYANESIHVEVRDWNHNKGDAFLGRTQIVFTSAPQPGLSIDHYTFPLGKRTDLDKAISEKAAVKLSYRVGEPGEGEWLGFDASDWPRTPNLPDHSKNHGVSLSNFRDIGGWPIRFRDRLTGIMVTGRMKERAVFRTSAVHRATEQDANLIKNELQIRNFVDLRTPDYAGNRGPFLSSSLTVLEPASGGTWTTSSQKIIVNEEEHSKIVARSSQQIADTASPAVPDDVPDLLGPKYDWSADDAASPTAAEDWGKLYLVCLVGPKFRSQMITKSKKMALVQAGFASTPQQQRRLICGPIFDHPDGISRLYFMLLECCKREFLLLFKLLLELTAQGPVGYFCNHGKDRTGFTTAFLQLICGVDRETVIDNYQLSDYFLQSIAKEVDDEMTDGGLTPAVMSRTPVRAMRSSLLYLDHRYGGPLEYLDHIGFSYEAQDVLRSRLVTIDPRFSPANLQTMSFQMLRSFTHATITIHSAKNLLPSDSSGSSDPFVKVTSMSMLVSEVKLNRPKILGQTDVYKDCLDPQWNYTFQTPTPINPGTRILFEVRDADENCEDDFIGTAEYSLDPPHPFANVHELDLVLRPTSSTIKISIVFHPTEKKKLAGYSSSDDENQNE